MIKLSEEIVGKAVDAEREQGLGQSVDQFGNAVVDRVKKDMQPLQDRYGDATRQLVGEAIEEAETYHQTHNRLLDPEATVNDLTDESAAGLVHEDTNEMELSEEAMAYGEGDKLEGYWNRVTRHEEGHQKLHSFRYEQNELEYFDESGQHQTTTVKGDQTERSSIRYANQPNGDLVPDYVEHARKGDEVVAVAGEEAVATALASTNRIGDLQRRIFEKQQGLFLEKWMEEQGEGGFDETN